MIWKYVWKNTVIAVFKRTYNILKVNKPFYALFIIESGHNLPETYMIYGTCASKCFWSLVDLVFWPCLRTQSLHVNW